MAIKIFPATDRFVLYDGDKEIGEMSYLQGRDGIVVIDHTLVNSQYQGRHLAEKLVRAGVDKARADGTKILPICPFAKKEFAEHAEYSDVLQK